MNVYYYESNKVISKEPMDRHTDTFVKSESGL